MKIMGVSFSYSKNSMGLRGLKLMDQYLNFDSLYQIDLPFCNNNKPDGNVPESVEEFVKLLDNSDVLVFSVPEYAEHCSAGFKNALDWLVVKQNFNSTLGQGYCISSKPTYVITFTPAKKGAGHRHFDITRKALEKLGADVRDCFVKNDGWDNVIPGNYNFVQKECEKILKDTETESNTKTSAANNMSNEVSDWIDKYNQWNMKWY